MRNSTRGHLLLLRVDGRGGGGGVGGGKVNQDDLQLVGGRREDVGMRNVRVVRAFGTHDKRSLVACAPPVGGRCSLSPCAYRGGGWEEIVVWVEF